MPATPRGTTPDCRTSVLQTGKADAIGRNRYYDATTGKFTQVDPVGIAGGVNLYGFAEGDPVNYSDPFGLCPPEDSNVQDCASVLFWRERAANASSLFGKVGNHVMAGLAAVGEDAMATAQGNVVGGCGTEYLCGTPPAIGTRPLLGRNPVAGSGSNPRLNTDLPGGRATAKSIFRNQTKGQNVTQDVMKNAGVRRTAPDGTQIRMNPDGSTRLDMPRGPTGIETIHIRP